MELSDWIKWAFRSADRPHRFASFVLARQASRDLGAEITTAEFEASMPFAVHHRNQRGSAYYMAQDTSAKRLYDFHRHVLAESIDHPLSADPRASFEALPPDDQTVVLAWIKTSLVPIRRTRTVAQLRYPCAVVTGCHLRNDEMRGALLAAGIEATGRWRFRCCLSDTAMANFRSARRAQLSSNQTVMEDTL